MGTDPLLFLRAHKVLLNSEAGDFCWASALSAGLLTLEPSCGCLWDDVIDYPARSQMTTPWTLPALASRLGPVIAVVAAPILLHAAASELSESTDDAQQAIRWPEPEPIGLWLVGVMKTNPSWQMVSSM